MWKLINIYTISDVRGQSYGAAVIAMARGLKFEIADKVHVIRNLDTQTEPVVIEASIKRAKRDGVSNIRLTAGDVVSVEETPTTLVVGTIRDFVRFGFSSAIPGF